MTSITLNDEQANALREALAMHIDGLDVQITQQGDRSIVVGFALTTVTIDRSGNIEEN